MKDNPYTLKGELMSKAQLMASVEADFDVMKWTFHSQHFECGAGDYVIIHKQDWDEIWNRHTNVAGPPESEE